MICEGSGMMNAVLLKGLVKRVVYLVDPKTIRDINFLTGGWAYYSSQYRITEFVVGEESSPITGSPLNSCIFSIPAFQKALKNSISSI
jgi:hypothetical protein